MQDWPIEVADAARLHEFADAYRDPALTRDERIVLMELVIASLDDVEDPGSHELWPSIQEILLSDFDLHKQTVFYWAVEEFAASDGFSVTPLMRALLRARA